MATSPALLSIDDYLHATYRPDADFVNGEIEERNMGEYQHARLQALIAALFITNEDSWSIQTVTEQRIHVATDRVRVCDIAILTNDAPDESVLTTPPLLCIEILSPEDRIPRAKLVLADYLAMGVLNIWLIDPVRRSASIFDAKGLRYADPTNLNVPNTHIHLDLTPAFAKLDRKVTPSS
jgi:Uma2 family endonuclease